MFVNEILDKINETEYIMDIETGSIKVCIRVNDDDEIINHPSLTDDLGNEFIVVGSVFDTHGYDNEYGGYIMMDLDNVGIHLSDVILMPEFIGETYYTIELNEYNEICWVAHDDDSGGDELIECESWI